MIEQFFLDKLGRSIGSCEDVERLRQFTLTLAMSGRLDAIRSGDQPASSMLQMIEITRKELIENGSLKSRRISGPLAAGDDFELPANWARTSINETCELRTGATPSRDRKDFFGGEIPWLVSGDVNKTEIFNCDGRITPLGMEKSNCNWLPPGAVVMALNGQGKTRGTVALLRVAATCNQSLVAIIPIRDDCLLPEYLFWNLRSRYHQLRGLTGSEGDRRGLNMKIISCLTLPLPPIEEQRRIVAKISTFMSLCDELEAALVERERHRDALRSESLHRLTDASSEPADIRFLLAQSPRLFTKQVHVEAVRAAILDLAVQGRLVPQDTADDPAASLLVDQGGGAVRRSNQAAEGQPRGWEAADLGQLATMITSGSRGWAQYYADSGAAFVRAQNIRFGHLRLDELAHVMPPRRSEGKRTRLEVGDLLIVITGAGVTNPALMDVDLGEAYVSQHVGLVKPRRRELSPWLLLCLMAAKGARGELIARAYGSGKPGLNLDNIRTLPVPIPPLAEQRRIVAKVDELMTLASELQSTLTSGQEARSQLLNSMLNAALQSGLSRSAPEVVATAI